MGQKIVQIENIYKSYSMGDNRLPVIHGLYLDIFYNELVAIMGRSGSGKSTLLNMIAGLESIDSGKIYIEHNEINRMSSKQKVLFRRDNLGIIYQFFNLVPALNVKENIILPFLIAGKNDHLIKERLEEVLEFTGMSNRKKHLPSQLSGGEMQLVTIARALIRHPKVILADEPTGNVNLETGKMIMQKLRNITKSGECSVILVTHSPEDASWADRIAFLKEGRIAPENSLEKEVTDAAHIYGRLKELGI